MYPSRFLLLRVLAGCWLAGIAQAGQINWGSTAGLPHLTTGDVALDATYTFELGAFDLGFTPTAANTADWAGRWNPVERVGYNADSQTFRGSYVMETNAAPFRTTDSGYIWGYSAPGSAKEWILLRHDTWKWPAVGGLAFPVSWTTASSEAVVGQVTVSGTPYVLKTASIASGEPPRITPAQWLVSFFSPTELANPAVSGWGADPDGDGKTNLDEMGMGTSPQVAEQSGLPIVTVVTSGGERYFQLEFIPVPAHSLSYKVEVSGDLKIWSSGSPATLNVANTLNRLVVRDVTPLGALKRRYIRLTFQLP